MKRFALFILLCAGCSTRHIVMHPDGTAEYVSKRFGSKEQIGKVVVTLPNKTVFEVQSYTSDQSQVIVDVAGAAAKGAVEGMKK